MRIKKIVPLAALLLATSAAAPFAATNLFSPHDWAMRLPKDKHHKRFSVGVNIFEVGVSERDGRSWDDKEVSILAIDDLTQSTIDMVFNPVTTVNNVNTAQVQIMLNAIAAMAPGGTLALFNNGTSAGQLALTGKFDQWSANLLAAYEFLRGSWGHFSLSVHVPVVHKEVRDVTIVDQTSLALLNNATNLAYTGVQIAALQHLLTDNIRTIAKTLGNLDLSNWDETGLGDVVALLNWKHMFKRCGHEHRSATLHAKIGVSFPTAEEKDEDKAFSMALGNDGAWGLPMGLGLEFQANKIFKFGVDGELLVLFDETRVRRLKTAPNQTEFLLLNKGNATMEHGLTWQVDAWAQAYHLWSGLSLTAAYQFVDHQHDTLVVKDARFNVIPNINGIVNTANSLKEWNVHNVIFRANYDFFQKAKKACCVPQVGVFYKLAVGGKHLIDADTYGAQFVLNF